MHHMSAVPGQTDLAQAVPTPRSFQCFTPSEAPGLTGRDGGIWLPGAAKIARWLDRFFSSIRRLFRWLGAREALFG